jgi:hypothetical protein
MSWTAPIVVEICAGILSERVAHRCSEIVAQRPDGALFR